MSGWIGGILCGSLPSFSTSLLLLTVSFPLISSLPPFSSLLSFVVSRSL